MKTKITLAMVMFIGFVLCSAAVAYYYMPIVLECPHCKTHFVQEETVSGNTIGSVLYTDGKKTPLCCRTSHGSLSVKSAKGYSGLKKL